MPERISVLDKGHMELTGVLASDLDVVNAARVSFNVQSEEMSDRDKGLIKYLIRNRHGTPFEHGLFRFRVKAPIFVFREWHRHRAGHSYNEWSARYSQLAPDFYIPATVLTQTGKPGNYSYEELDSTSTEHFQRRLEDSSSLAYQLYEEALASGVAKQQARLFLPVNTYSEMIWTCNPRSLMHFLSLRNAPEAQMEIREYAKVAEMFFSQYMPVTAAAFVDGGRQSP
jgi:thymidylate synthase (FAD)